MFIISASVGRISKLAPSTVWVVVYSTKVRDAIAYTPYSKTTFFSFCFPGHKSKMVASNLKIRLITTDDSSRNYIVLLLIIALSGIIFDFIMAYFISELSGAPIFNSEGFINRSKNTLLNWSFYTSGRPFTTDFLYKIYGSKPPNAVIGQQILSAFGWTLLGFAVSLTIKRKLLSVLALIVFSTLAFWWNIAGWTYVMRSESSAFSLFAFWYAMMVLYHKYHWPVLLVLLSVVTLFFSFTRDNVPYFLVLVSALMLVISFFGQSRKQRRGWLIYFIIVVIIFILQAISAQIGARHQFPLINVLFQRILVDEEKTHYFVSHGMPVDDDFITRWKGQWASSHGWNLYKEAKYEDFRNFTLHEGKYVYGLFLLNHADYTFKSAWNNRHSIFTTNATPYTGKTPPDHIMIVSQFWELYRSATFLLILMSVLSLLFIRNYPYLFVIIPCTIINGIFIYHADAMEVMRHSLMIMIVLCTVSMHTLFKISDTLKLSSH